MSRVNIEYLKPINEPLWFLLALIRQRLGRKPKEAEGALIVNVCLVGEFAASVPAMHALMQKLEEPVDVLVSPPLKTLAERLRGVRHAHIARSSFGRANEVHDDACIAQAYETIYLLRMSADAYRMLRGTAARGIRTGLFPYLSYGFHLAWCWVRGKTPRPWREVNFRMVGLPEHYLSPEELFDFSAEEYAAARTLPGMGGPEKTILIHTGASWIRNRWPLEYWAELLTLLNAHGSYRFVFVGAPKDQADFEAISKKLAFPIYSLIGKIDLVQLFLALRAADYFIGVDSGPRNLAHLAGTPSVTLLGPAPHMYTPWNPRDQVLDKSGGRHLRERFIATRGQSLMERHSSQEVFEAFKKL